MSNPATSQPALDRLFDALAASARASGPRLLKRNAAQWTPHLHWSRLFPFDEEAPAARDERIALLRGAIAGEKLRAQSGSGAGFAPPCPNRLQALKGALLAERLARVQERAAADNLQAVE